jgi:hypothetical protein
MTRSALYVRLTAGISLVALVPAMALPSRSSEARNEAISLAELKRVYLACEHAAGKGELDTGEIIGCSRAYEDLKRRAFGGDFKLLRAWLASKIVVEGR